METTVNERQTVSLNQLLYMQIRILRMFCDRHNMSINEASRMFEDNQIFSLIEYGWDGYIAVATNLFTKTWRTS